MSRTHRLTLIAALAAAAATTTSWSGGTATALTAAADTGSTTERERGIVLECRGSAHGLDAYTSVYENDRYSNYVQVVLGDDPDASASREPRGAILREGNIRTGVAVDGSWARVTGTAQVVGKRSKVHEVHDDAGQHIVVDGHHRRLRNHLTLTYRGTSVPLVCSEAFRYDLTVRKTPIGA